MAIQETNNLPQTDPRHHALNLAQSLREISQHAAQDVRKVESGQELLQKTADRLDQMARELEEFGYRKD
jgi:hypothetical protein